MRDVDGVDTSTTLAGHAVSMPVALAPVGMAGMGVKNIDKITAELIDTN